MNNNPTSFTEEHAERISRLESKVALLEKEVQRLADIALHDDDVPPEITEDDL